MIQMMLLAFEANYQHRKVLYTSPHLEVQLDPIRPLFAPRCYIHPEMGFCAFIVMMNSYDVRILLSEADNEMVMTKIMMDMLSLSQTCLGGKSPIVGDE